MSRLELIQRIKLDLKKDKFQSTEMEAYPWDECIADQVARYGDEETAKKVCGAIKAGMKKSFQEGDSLEGACWEGWEAIGLKEKDGRLVPNCVPIKEEQSKVKEGFPVPSPSGSEDEQAFISRCMSEIGAEYEQSQALAICYSKWEGK